MNRSRFKARRIPELGDRGLSLVEILVSIALLSLFVQGSLRMSGWMLDSVKEESRKADRNVENVEMLKLFTQPVYFGSLSKFPENSQLAKCMSLDGQICDSRLEYPVTPFDLKSETVLATASAVAAGKVHSSIRFQIHCPAKAATCDKAEFYTVKVTTGLGDGKGGLQHPIVKTGVVVPEFANVATFVPDSTMAPGRPINVMVWVDNSNSMVAVKGQIKDALEKLLNKLANLNANVGIFPISGENNYKFAPYYYIDADGNKQSPLPPKPYPVGFAYYLSLEARAPVYSAYNPVYDPSLILNTYGLTMRVYQFSPDMTSTQRERTLQAMKYRIDYLFANLVLSDDDHPLCDVFKLMDGPEVQTLLPLDRQTPTVALIITNENDNTVSGPSIGLCQRTYTTKYWIQSMTYHYYVAEQTRTVNLTVSAIKDGAPYQATFSFPYISAYDPGRVVGTDCMPAILADEAAGIFRPALDDHLSRSNYGWKYKPGEPYTIHSCKESVNKDRLISHSSSPSPVCAEVANGTRPVSIAYIPGSCREDLIPVTQSTNVANSLYYPAGHDGEIASYAYESVNNRIGASNFFFIPIIHPDTTTCPMPEGTEEVGTRYLQLANRFGENATVIPVCSPDYARPLDRFQQWVDSLGASDYVLPEAVAANFSGIALVRNGNEINLTRNVDYTLSGQVVMFTPGLVQPNDVIKVYLQ
ncbi:MAG: hypothetical protein NDI61_01205 [Bdellovibrionaceae bacterium]|nr:hypothetical protein [Pseudobdellovibrionaceae bacterium]